MWGAGEDRSRMERPGQLSSTEIRIVRQRPERLYLQAFLASSAIHAGIPKSAPRLVAPDVIACSNFLTL